MGNTPAMLTLDSVLLVWSAGMAAAMAVLFVGLAPHLQLALAANVVLSLVGYEVTRRTIMSPQLKEMFIKASLKGIDLNKATTHRHPNGALVRPIAGVPIPESQGAVSSTVYILVLSVLIPCIFGGNNQHADFSHARLAEYLAALLSVGLAAFMGFADDVLDLRWRHKIPLPFLANLPLLLVYHAAGGLTGFVVPNQLQWLLGPYLELSIFFYLFLLGLVVVSTHAINIYAGVNGLEVGQAVVIAGAVAILNIVLLIKNNDQGADAHEFRMHQMQSLMLVLPFLATSIALMRLNWWPSKVFVGDTYAYFAGATLAAVSVVGHSTKTMTFLLIPQFLNALYSVPQLFKVVDCPRHRMPGYDSNRDVLLNSYFEIDPENLSKSASALIWLLRTFRLAKFLPADPKTGFVQVSNLTLPNFFMHAFGECREDVLCSRLLMFQALCAVLLFFIRFGLAGYCYDVVR